jgi:hypothetical protein
VIRSESITKVFLIAGSRVPFCKYYVCYENHLRMQDELFAENQHLYVEICEIYLNFYNYNELKNTENFNFPFERFSVNYAN